MTASLGQLRARLAKHYSSTKTTTQHGVEVHGVTFQPRLTRQNQDRLLAREISVCGQDWLLLAVCDGQGGASTARYVASHLSWRICNTLERALENGLHGRLDRENIQEKANFISSELRRCINDLDRELGDVIRGICPDPTGLTAETASSLVLEYPDELARACSGTTLAAALVNVNHRLMWAINVGDSTVALSSVHEDGKRVAHELCPRQSMHNSRERHKVIAAHPQEKKLFKDGRILGSLAVTRAIGHFPFKMPSAYSKNLFRFLSLVGPRRFDESVIDDILSPPYVTADPFIRFVDLDAVSSKGRALMLYTNGVDHLLNCCRYLHPLRQEDLIPSHAVAVLLQDEVDDSVEQLLGYPVDLRWTGEGGNRAVDVLGNLIGCTSHHLLQSVMDQAALEDRSAVPRLSIDDTTIVLCFLPDVTS